MAGVRVGKEIPDDGPEDESNKRGVGYAEAKILNIIVRRADAGYDMETDPRHAELIVDQVA